MAAQAAPLFPDVPDNHWAKDAVAALAAKGLVEGYPDGTFKGDRSASRWETAMIVARLLAKMEQAHATFATKAELDELRKLTEALREELGALGVRVDNLEEEVGQIDQRVTELERITFYGSLETRVAMQSFNNDGPSFSDPTDAVLNYDNLVGSVPGAGGAIVGGPAAGLNFDPYAFGTMTVNNLKTGRPLSSGTGFTSKAILGLQIEVSDEIDAGLELVAFSSQGDRSVDLYYGVSAPYLNNAFTAISTVNGGAGTQPSNNRPFTRMNLDHFWVKHDPTKTYVRVGALRDFNFDTLVYQKQYNPGTFGGPYLDSFGFQVKGEIDLNDEGDMLDWEVIGTLLPDRNGGVGGSSYRSNAWGLNLGYNFDGEAGEVRANFLRASQDATGGAARQVGLITGVNFGPIPWVNPPGFYFNQLGGPNNNTGGIASTGDIRPIPSAALGNDGITGVPGQANFGNLGPQDQNSYGLSAEYTWDNEYSPRLRGEYAHSEYSPNQNSSYNVGGDAFRVSAGATFFDEVDLDLEYLSVDPTYDPFVLQIPRIGGILRNGMRMGENFFNYRGDLYSLHDTEIFPHNREGFRGKLNWQYHQYGSVTLKGGFLDQKEASLQDVRFSAGAIANGIPNTPVLGFSPGFVEPVFGGFSPFTFGASGTNQFAVPLEAPTGSSDFFSLGAQHRFVLEEDERGRIKRGVTLSGRYYSTNYKRVSNLRALVPGPNGIAGENVNNVDLTHSGWEIQVDYDLTPDFTVLGGYGSYIFAGHYDPFGVYSPYAVSVNNTNFDTFDIEQTQPFVGFNYDITEQMSWDLTATLVDNKDRVSGNVFATPTIPSTNSVFTPQRSTHPFNWDGIMVNSSFQMKF